jgi:phosphoglycerate kinase
MGGIMGWKTLDDMELTGKRVLTRVDINVPMQGGQVTDATRIEKIAPTVRDILAAGGIPILLAHFGRPKGERVDGMSLRHLVPALEQHLSAPVLFVADCVGPAAAAAIGAAVTGQVVLLENTRFHKAEEKNDADFSAAHRAHASTEGVARRLPACAGRLMQAELSALEAALATPKRPVVAVVGGAKVSTKIELLGNLVAKVDYLVIGGGMANTFLAAQGVDVGKSLAEHDMTGTATDIMAKAAGEDCKIILPRDVVVAREFAANATNETVAADACPVDAMVLDAGPESVAQITDVFKSAKTLIWNGPLGAFEIEPFDRATNAAAAVAAQLSQAGDLISVAGGGDTVAALKKAEAADKFTYISTAGGAFLEWMEGKTLPGVAALIQ